MRRLLLAAVILWTSWAWASVPAKMVTPGIRINPHSQEAIRNDIRKIQHLLNLDDLIITLPRVFWLRDGEEVRLLHNQISGCIEINELYGIYAPLHNQIFLSKKDYFPQVFWHELAHCVLWQTGRHWKMNLSQEESLCHWVAEQMEKME